MGLVLHSVDIKPVAGQERVAGGINSYLEKDELITMLENTIEGLKASQ
jgi:LytS/YehU family sensor histidine kinase